MKKQSKTSADKKAADKKAKVNSALTGPGLLTSGDLAEAVGGRLPDPTTAPCMPPPTLVTTRVLTA